MKHMTHLDLFSGYGGFALACQRLGITTVGVSEVDKYANAVLRARFPGIKNYGDVSQINPEDIPDVEIITGGSPCQDVSVAGKRAGIDGKRSGLFFHFSRIISVKRPHYFVWENVRGVLSSNHGRDFARVVAEFSSIGYDLQWQILNTRSFGVPQNRERIVIVGNLRGRSRRKVLPIRTGYEATNNNRIEAVFPVVNNHGVLEERDVVNCIDANYFKGRDNHSQRTHIAVPIAMPVLTPERGEKRGNGRRFKPNGEPMFTLTTQDRHGVYDGYRIRRLTPRECDLLQGLPADWTATGVDDGGNEVVISDTQRYKLTGNGVTVTVMSAVIAGIRGGDVDCE